MTEELIGTIERVTFHNAQNGFSVLRVRPKGSMSPITVVGHLPTVAAGENILARGAWRDDRTHGRQFQAEAITPQRATGRAQIESFLGSGAIRGIGPHLAQLLYEHFREKIFDIIEESPQRLREVAGIGDVRARMITESWQQKKNLRELMIFLADTGIGAARAARIHKQFGADAVRLIRENPYRLAQEIRGIGFVTADTLAIKLGMARDSIERIRAGVVHALTEGSTSGHTGMPADDLVTTAAELLSVTSERVREAIVLEAEAGRLIGDKIEGRNAVFLPWLHRAERRIAENLRRLSSGLCPWPDIDVDKAIAWVIKKTGTPLAPSQRAALALVLHSKVTVVTGGPGVGKTTLVDSILRILMAKKATILLAAPTGRAARRLAESTGLEAKTIHRLLEVEALTGRFARSESNPLSCDLLVVDETSMIDVPLMDAMLRALPSSSALLLVGDVDQLPAVGPGQVLADIIASNSIPVVRLTEVFRQAAESRIVVNAHAINEGRMPELGRPDSDDDFFFVKVTDPARAIERVVQLVSERIPKRFGLDPIRQIQVLCPMRRSGAGVESLNEHLQAAINPWSRSADASKLERMGVSYVRGDKVMQIINDYEKDVFNGDLGVIEKVDVEDGVVAVDFDGKLVEYDRDELDDLVLAYATTIHKSQGSEYPAVVIVLMMQHAIMLQRNLLYTAVTRGRQLVVIVGEERALQQAVSIRSARRRWSKLREWLEINQANAG